MTFFYFPYVIQDYQNQLLFSISSIFGSKFGITWDLNSKYNSYVRMFFSGNILITGFLLGKRSHDGILFSGYILIMGLLYGTHTHDGFFFSRDIPLFGIKEHSLIPLLGIKFP